LHASLLLRLVSDGLSWPAGRAWGATGNALAIGLFLLNTVVALVLASWKRPAAGPGVDRQAI
jgi:hypothetical protein